MKFAIASLVALSCLTSVSVAHAQDAAKAETKPSKQTPAPQTGAKPGARADRLDLDTTTVTGNRELPKVLYIVPWKKAELGELPAQPFNTLLDEVLTPVDRDVFKREVKYFQTVTEQSAVQSATPTTPNASQR